MVATARPPVPCSGTLVPHFLRGCSEVVDQPQPFGDPVPTCAVLVPPTPRSRLHDELVIQCIRPELRATVTRTSAGGSDADAVAVINRFNAELRRMTADRMYHRLLIEKHARAGD